MKNLTHNTQNSHSLRALTSHKFPSFGGAGVVFGGAGVVFGGAGVVFGGARVGYPQRCRGTKNERKPIETR